jgi:hypothetical protein
MTRDTFDHFQPKDRGLFGDNEQRESESKVTRSNLCDLDLFCHNDNPSKQAIAVSTDIKTPFAKWIWLPRSLIEYVRTGAVRNCITVRVTLPEPFAKEKGLI